MSPTDPTLPASRQPVPVAPEVQAEIDRRGRSAAQIERDISARTERLAANIDELSARLAPRRLLADRVNGVKEKVIAPDGRPRPEVVGGLAGVVAAVGFLLWRSRRR